MKKKIFTIGFVILGASLNAQVSDSVALGAGYANESYYSFADGEVANVDNSNWDLAFDVSNFGATIRTNRLSEIYLYPGAISDWETIDSTGLSGWTRYYNSDVNWSFGAMNAPASSDDPTDLGWGQYNTTTHFTEGNRLFIIKLQSGDFKKLFIEKLGAGAYTFKYAKLDNSELINETINKSDYSNKNFIHYSLETEEVILREPNSSEWDIVFSNYHSEIAPATFYGVTGILANKGIETLQVDATPTADANFSAPFSTAMNVIGYDWKSFVFATFSYAITDSLTYFISSNTGDIWKLILTGFNGSSDGKFYFSKEKVSALGINEIASFELNTYPNPAVEVLNITATENLNAIHLYNTNGQLVLSNSSVLNATTQINVSEFEKGMYILETISESGLTRIQKIIITN